MPAGPQRTRRDGTRHREQAPCGSNPRPRPQGGGKRVEAAYRFGRAPGEGRTCWRWRSQRHASGSLAHRRSLATACLILDVRMPGMGGLELQRQLAAAGSRIPIIFITAHEDEETRTRALQAGAVDFLAKPFSEEALLTAVQVALEHDRDEA
jgi:CheY-like chemotaxis protein